jgi:hypothetical protein
VTGSEVASCIVLAYGGPGAEGVMTKKRDVRARGLWLGSRGTGGLQCGSVIGMPPRFKVLGKKKKKKIRKKRKKERSSTEEEGIRARGPRDT